MLRATRLIAVNLGLTLALLLLVEVGSRWLAPTPMPQPLAAGDNEVWVTEREFHPDLFWRLKPRRDASGAVVINQLGLRGPLPGPKRPGELRLLSLGESTTAAMRLPLAQTYTKVAEGLLRRATGRPVAAINAGTGGYTLAQGVTFFRLHGLELEPDVVLTYFGFNDFVQASYRVERDAGATAATRELTDLELQAERRKPLIRGLLALERHSNFVRWLAQRRAPSEVRRGGKRRVPAPDRLVLYRELAELCAAEDTRLIVLVPAYREFRRHEAFLRKLATEHGFEVLDLAAALDSKLTPRAPYFFDPVHPRAEAHRLMGEVIAEHLGADSALP